MYLLGRQPFFFKLPLQSTILLRLDPFSNFMLPSLCGLLFGGLNFWVPLVSSSGNIQRTSKRIFIKYFKFLLQRLDANNFLFFFSGVYFTGFFFYLILLNGSCFQNAQVLVAFIPIENPDWVVQFLLLFLSLSSWRILNTFSLTNSIIPGEYFEHFPQ